MLNTGEYASYKEFGLDLIKKLDIEGFSNSILKNEESKRYSFLTPQEIELQFYGFKANARDTMRRLGRFSYDCLVRYKDDNVTFETICKEIIYKCYHSSYSETLVKNIIYLFLKTLANHPLTSDTVFLKGYCIYDDKLCKISEIVVIDNFNDDIIKASEEKLEEVLTKLDKIGKYSLQEMINIISYIAIMEEINYPLVQQKKGYRGRCDCFGRYVEVLFGNVDELYKLIESNSFSNGAIFTHDEKYEKYYLTSDINEDRLELDVYGNYF